MEGKSAFGALFLPPVVSRCLMKNFDLAGIGFEAAGEDVEEGSFPRAIFSPQEDDFALADLARDAIKHGLSAEGLAQVFETQQQHWSLLGGGFGAVSGKWRRGGQGRMKSDER